MEVFEIPLIFNLTVQLFGDQMYTALNPRIASTVLGAASFLLVPVPFLLLKWGPALRKKSRYAMEVPQLYEQPAHRAARDAEEGEGAPDIKASDTVLDHSPSRTTQRATGTSELQQGF